MESLVKFILITPVGSISKITVEVAGCRYDRSEMYIQMSSGAQYILV